MAEIEPYPLEPKRFRYKKIVISAIFLFIISASCLSGWYFSYVHTAAPALAEQEVVVTIPPGSPVRAIGEILAEAGVIRYDFRFLLLAKFSGLGRRLQAGEFNIKTGTVPREVLLSLATVKPLQHKVTIPEGLNAVEISQLLETAGWGSSKSFLNLVRDKEFIEKLGLEGVQDLEGYLFPDTYYLTRNTKGSREIISKMVGRFHSVWQNLSQDITPGHDREKTVILASIVEKETGSAKERGLIAGVFLNRLRLGMKLQSDPTVLYGVPEQSGSITKKHLRTKTPYNTYMISGLPVGPICNPGADALHAVLFPEISKNLFFVSKNNGTHKFSSTLSEHNKAVLKYQRKKTVKKGK